MNYNIKTSHCVCDDRHFIPEVSPSYHTYRALVFYFEFKANDSWCRRRFSIMTEIRKKQKTQHFLCSVSVIARHKEALPAALCSPWSQSHPWADKWCRSGPYTGRDWQAGTWSSYCTLWHTKERIVMLKTDNQSSAEVTGGQGWRRRRGQARPDYRDACRVSSALRPHIRHRRRLAVHLPSHLLLLASWSLWPPASILERHLQWEDQRCFWKMRYPFIKTSQQRAHFFYANNSAGALSALAWQRRAVSPTAAHL